MSVTYTEGSGDGKCNDPVPEPELIPEPDATDPEFDDASDEPDDEPEAEPAAKAHKKKTLGKHRK